jgi:hypothetical protein
LVAIIAVCINAIRWTLGSTADNDLARLSEASIPIRPPAPPRIVSRLGDPPCIEVLRLSGRDHESMARVSRFRSPMASDP